MSGCQGGHSLPSNNFQVLLHRSCILYAVWFVLVAPWNWGKGGF